jgi:diguanylate cyclase (GGDEF)-like protein
MLALVCWRSPHVLPARFWLGVPFAAIMLVAGLNLATSDASTAAQLFFLWPLLYSANFLSRRLAYYTLAAAMVGQTVVGYYLLAPGQATADVIAMALAMAMTTVVILPLRTRTERLTRTLAEQARVDPLTGLDNRRACVEALAEAVTWAQRTSSTLALLAVDVDYFKKINDTYGHAVGDRALQEVAEAMRQVVGPDDRVARPGGDEFLIIMRIDRRGALNAIAQFRARLARVRDLPGGPPGLSVGVGLFPDHADTVDALIAAADSALYTAKSNGRGREAVYDEQASAGASSVAPPAGWASGTDTAGDDVCAVQLIFDFAGAAESVR